jgi:hypothetical protein
MDVAPPQGHDARKRRRAGGRREGAGPDEEAQGLNDRTACLRRRRRWTRE